MVTQMASALVATGQAAQPYGNAPQTPQRWRSADDDARLLRYRLFLNFHAGKHDVGRLPAGQNPVQANYARVFVGKAASYLLPEPVRVNVGGPDGAEAIVQRIEDVLSRVTESNDLDAADLATAVDSAVLGDGAYKVTWDRSAGLPRIVPVDPQHLFVQSAGDDVRRPLVVRQVIDHQHMDVENTYGLSRAEIPDAPNVVLAECWSEDAYWLDVGGQAMGVQRNPYGFIPYLVWPNMPRPHEFWGLSDLVDIIDVNRALDRRLSSLGGLLEIGGNPIAVLENVQGSAGINVAPGAVWEIPENAKAYLLELLGPQTVAQHLAYIEALYRILDDLSEMPRMSFGDGGPARSGVALQIQLQPVVQKIGRKRLVWSSMVQRRARLSLRLLQQMGRLDLGGYELEDFTLEATWAPVLPSDRQALVADEIALYNAGLHARRTAVKALGVEDVDAEIAAVKADPPPMPGAAGTDPTHDGVPTSAQADARAGA